MNDLINFGDSIGITNQNVIAFSNNDQSKDTKNKSKPNYYNEIYTGLKYECVEFVRRWLIIVYGITFESVNHAKNIFELKNFYSIKNSLININEFLNGSYNNIYFGDLIIWNYKGEFSSYGHVAIVVKIKNNFIYIAEQNTSNKSWNGKKYSRKLLFDNNLLVDKDYTDTEILGWINYNKNL